MRYSVAAISAQTKVRVLNQVVQLTPF